MQREDLRQANTYTPDDEHLRCLFLDLFKCKINIVRKNSSCKTLLWSKHSLNIVKDFIEKANILNVSFEAFNYRSGPIVCGIKFNTEQSLQIFTDELNKSHKEMQQQHELLARRFTR